jgi:hypothetical protein
MNFHLITVHFPIALLTFYAFLEIISIKRLRNLPYWWYIKAALVIAGIISTFATLETGSLIEQDFSFVRNVVEVHSFWAYITTAIFSVLGGGYLIGWIDLVYPTLGNRFGKLQPVLNLLLKLKSFILHRAISFILALSGLIAVTITGSLGGAISQGPEIDPVVSFVYHLLVK